MAVYSMCSTVIFVMLLFVTALGGSGQATYYENYSPSACYGDKMDQYGNMIAAVSTDLYNKGLCGEIFQVTCKGSVTNGGGCTNSPSVNVRVVDHCPSCAASSFDLSREAFAKIADLKVGIIHIDWNKVYKLGFLSANAKMKPVGPGAGLGLTPAVGVVNPIKALRKRDYRLTNRLQETKRPLYAITFNFLDVRYHDTFATAGGNRITIYQCFEGGAVAILQAYVDEDKEEAFYTVSWACDPENLPLLIASGQNGIIRVIHCGYETLANSFVGHGGSVNELRTQSQNPFLIASASKDESIRLWNVHTGVCILIFAGAAGHRNEVLSVDFHPSNVFLMASCGMDNTIKIWSFKDFSTYIEESKTWNDATSRFPTKHVQYPIFNAAVHSNYVDCTRWLGDLILSKSVDNEVVLWEPIFKEESPSDGAVDIIQKYPVPDCDLWFIKFSCDYNFNTLSVGNKEGKVVVWDIQSSPPNFIAKLSNSQCRLPIRQTATSVNGRTILTCCEDGSIWRWDALV